MKLACIGEISGAADAVALEPTQLEHLPGAELARRVLEHRAEVRFVVGCVALRRVDQLAHLGPDLARRRAARAGTRRPRRPGRAEARVAVREPELGGREPTGPVGRRDERADEDRAPVAPVRAGVHPHPSAGRPGDRARELEAAERRGAGAVEADRVRRASAGGERRPLHPRLGELAREPQHEHVDARRPPRARSSRDPPSRPEARARAQPRSTSSSSASVAARRYARARPPVPIVVSRASATPSSNDGIGHAGSPSTIARAIFHGSPTPNVITRSPGRAHASASVAASSSDGAQPARTSGGSESTTSLPETPSRGASRAPMMSVTIAASASPSACPELARAAAGCARRRAAGRRRSPGRSSATAPSAASPRARSGCGRSRRRP